MAHDVFLSYSHKDSEIVNKIYEELKTYGISCWSAEVELQPGMDFVSYTGEAIGSSAVFIPIISSDYNRSAYCNKELDFAIVSMKTVIPVIVEKDYELTDENQFYFGMLQMFRFDSGDLKDNVKSLSKAIFRILGRDLSAFEKAAKPKDEGKITVFLSHSHKDIDKVRKLRNMLEYLDCEPLIFFLKCLDDGGGELEPFIQREIEARNVFLYCKSENSEKSDWVQRELAHIRKVDSNRLYTIDIDKNLTHGMIGLLRIITQIVSGNQIFLCSATDDIDLTDTVRETLINNGYKIYGENVRTLSNNEVLERIRETGVNGIFLPIITDAFLKNLNCINALENAFKEDIRMFAVYVGEIDSEKYNLSIPMKYYLSRADFYDITAENNEESASLLVKMLTEFTQKKEPQLMSTPEEQLPDTICVGRDSEVEELHRLLADNSAVFVSAPAGNGKTTLAHYYRKIFGDCYDTVIYFDCSHKEGGLESFIADDDCVKLENFTLSTENRSVYIREKLDAIKKNTDSKTLFIVDGYTVGDEFFETFVRNAPYKLLFLTRCENDGAEEFRRYPTFDLDPIGADILKALFVKLCSSELIYVNPNDKALSELIELANGSVLTVEMMAEMMPKAGTVSRLLDELKNKNQ